VALGEVGDQLAGCSPLAAEAIVDAAVGLHAPTWGRAEELLSHGWLTRPDATTFEMRVGAYRHLLPGFVERFSGRLGSEVIDTARWLGERLVDVALAYRSPMCLVHGDFRLDNMLFDPSASASTGAVSVTVVDWQTVGLGRGAVDVAYGLGSGLPPEDRRRVESSLVDRYVGGLSAHGVTGDEVADAVRHDYRLGATSGLAMSVIASQLVASTPRGDEMFAVMAERHAAQMFDNDTADLVGG
jgi:aminoglycoside phosphotransferase (APT) family kinase protein